MSSGPMGEVVRVLVVEDDPWIRDGILTTLATVSDRVDVVAEADNARDAIRSARQHSPDVILVDLKLPIGRGDVPRKPDYGIALIKVLTKDQVRGRPTVMVLSGYDREHGEVIAHAFSAGALSYLAKSYDSSTDPDSLADAIVRTAHGEACYGPDISYFASAAKSLPSLTKREKDVKELLALRLDDESIAQRLGISSKTVKTHVSNMIRKLHADCRHEVAKAKVPADDLFGLDRI